LFGGKRLAKDHIRIEAYGTVDELNSAIGICRSMNTVQEVDGYLEEIQNSLFTLGADLATPGGTTKRAVRRIRQADAERLEAHLDAIPPQLPPLTEFVLPGGSRTSAHIHMAGSICRRAERRVVSLDHAEPVGSAVIIYLNRLSDLLFVMARWVNILS